MHKERQITWKHRLEFGLLWGLTRVLGALPRSCALRVGGQLGSAAYTLVPRLRRVGETNLKLAFPDRTASERDRLLRAEYKHLGRLLAEFCQMRHYSAAHASSFIRYQGLEHYLAARAQGRGTLILTGHLGAWELSSFFHSLMGYRMGMVIRRLDNVLVDSLVNELRCLHGNWVLHKDDFARGLLTAMRAGQTVGILMDTNMRPPQGVFAPFFGVPACTASGLARVARKTGAAVVPGFLLWEEREQQYVLHFGERLTLHATEDADADVLANTALFNHVLESYIRRYPSQWLWLHRRWKTRPAGESAIYG